MSDFIKAKIRWYDSLAGRGMIRLESGESKWFDWTSTPEGRAYLEENTYTNRTPEHMLGSIRKNRTCVVKLDEFYGDVTRIIWRSET